MAPDNFCPGDRFVTLWSPHFDSKQRILKVRHARSIELIVRAHWSMADLRLAAAAAICEQHQNTETKPATVELLRPWSYQLDCSASLEMYYGCTSWDRPGFGKVNVAPTLHPPHHKIFSSFPTTNAYFEAMPIRFLT